MANDLVTNTLKIGMPVGSVFYYLGAPVSINRTSDGPVTFILRYSLDESPYRGSVNELKIYVGRNLLVKGIESPTKLATDVSRQQEAFSLNIWQNRNLRIPPVPRTSMVDDLVANTLKVGLPIRAVLQLLGAPEGRPIATPKGFSLFYYLDSSYPVKSSNRMTDQLRLDIDKELLLERFEIVAGRVWGDSNSGWEHRHGEEYVPQSAD